MTVCEVSETIRAKASRLLITGSVTITVCRDGHGEANVVGDTGVYEVRFGPTGVTCDCPAYTKACSHAIAVGLVTVPTMLDSS